MQGTLADSLGDALDTLHSAKQNCVLAIPSAGEGSFMLLCQSVSIFLVAQVIVVFHRISVKVYHGHRVSQTASSYHVDPSRSLLLMAVDLLGSFKFVLQSGSDTLCIIELSGVDSST